MSEDPTTPDAPVEPPAEATPPQAGLTPILRTATDDEQTAPEAAPPSEGPLFKPPIDIYESDDGLVLVADLPGVTVETLDLQVQNNKLTLYGHVTAPAEGRPGYAEYEVGDFVRSFILSDQIDHERIGASMKDGVLKVTLPRVDRGPARRIEIAAE
ncbi:MAG: Hsp20/alpha crystallin family protein [Planctomycetota bacterium]